MSFGKDTRQQPTHAHNAAHTTNQPTKTAKPQQWVLIGGYLVNPASIPVWLRWVRCLSPMSFAFEVLAANEIGDQYFSIHVDGFPEIGGVKGDGAWRMAWRDG
jgi:hypothetical protein